MESSSIEKFRIKFGKNLKILRKEGKVSAEALAIKSGLSDKTYIYSVERGEKDIQLSTIFKLAQGLEIEPKKLLDFKI